MNNTIETLTTRRSIRSYTPKQIPMNQLNAILEAGMYAPSGKGRQSVTMVVVQDATILAKLSTMNAHIMGKNIDPFYGAPTVIIVFSDPDSGTITPVEDGTLVIGNLMNAATSLGIGSCWIHRAKQEFDSEEGKQLLSDWGLPERYIGIGHCALGYPASEPPVPVARKENFVVFAK